MKKRYQRPKLQLFVNELLDFIIMSGDGYADDPWSEGFGGEL